MNENDVTEETGGTDETDRGPVLARRGLVFGAGTAALVGATLAGGLPAGADPGSKPSDPAEQRRAAERQDLSPVTSTIASSPISGYTYRHVSWLDFQPESGAANRVYGGYGVYSSGSSPYLWATVEIPAGALVRDIEWYVRNVSADSVTALGRIWAAGTGSLFATLADTTITSSSSAVVARRSVVSSSNYGPHPLGTKIVLGLDTSASATVQINGARVGFSQGAGAVGLLPAPVRVYDSRVTGGILTAGTTRTVTLPSSLVRPGTAGVVVNITAVLGVGIGYLKVYPGNAAAPAASTMNFDKSKAIANMVFVGVSSSRQIKFYASTDVHVVVDVTGVIG